MAQGGMVPLGYYKDPEKSAKTFKEIDGTRYAFIGDMATIDADGTINLLGRAQTASTPVVRRCSPRKSRRH